MKKLLCIISFFFAVFNAQSNCVSGTVAAPVVDSITVDIAGNVTICWQAVPDPDVVSYTIFMINPITSANDSINIVAAPGNCFTLPFGLNTSDLETVELGVVAKDVCNNSSPVGVNYHNTIHLENTLDICAASISLTWNAYDDFPTGTNLDYKVFVSVNAGPYSITGNTTALNYTYAGIVQGSTYDFYVVGVENNGVGPASSSSNDIQINTVNFLKDPAYNYLYTATVVDSQLVDVQFYVDTSADISHYNIQRSESITGPFVTIGSVSASIGMNPLVTYYDYDVNAIDRYYVYQVETINSCGDLKLTSNIGKTIWLYVESDGVGEKNILTFTSYENWLGGVNTYEIHRSVGGIWESSPVATVSAFGDTAVYEDNIMQVVEGNGEFCYKVIAQEGVIAHVGGIPAASSTSNESCALHEPLLYVPNAFSPLSPYNYEFKPVLTFSEPAGYLMQIYNRWGQIVFETKELDVGWNGRPNNVGLMSPIGSYVYLIKFQGANGDDFSKRGLINLLN